MKEKPRWTSVCVCVCVCVCARAHWAGWGGRHGCHLSALKSIPCLSSVYIAGSYISSTPLTVGFGKTESMRSNGKKWKNRRKEHLGYLALSVCLAGIWQWLYLSRGSHSCHTCSFHVPTSTGWFLLLASSVGGQSLIIVGCPQISSVIGTMSSSHHW